MISQSVLRWLGASCGLVLLAACSTLEVPKSDASASFDARGRLSVHYQELNGGKEDTVFGRFEWIEHGDIVDLSLLDPLGQGVATVHAAPGHAELKLSDGRQFEGTSADQLTREALGYTVPIEGLRSWLLGRASVPGSAPVPGKDGGLDLKEAGWSVHYPAVTMPPRRIDLSYPGPEVALEIRIAIEPADGS